MIFWSFCGAKSTRPGCSRLAAQFDLETRPTRTPAHPDVVTLAQPEHVGEFGCVLGGFCR